MSLNIALKKKIKRVLTTPDKFNNVTIYGLN